MPAMREIGKKLVSRTRSSSTCPCTSDIRPTSSRCRKRPSSPRDSNGCRPGGSRDPPLIKFDVLRLSAVEQTERNIVRWQHPRPSEAGLGTHKLRTVPGFTKKYGVDRLVWFEQHASLESAYVRERQIKEWKRAWKIQLIEADNSQWIDLYPSLSP